MVAEGYGARDRSFTDVDSITYKACSMGAACYDNCCTRRRCARLEDLWWRRPQLCFHH